jgi:hypothetical protein
MINSARPASSVWKRQEMFRYKIQQRFPKAAEVTTEIKYSVSTMVIFGWVIYAVVVSLRPYVPQVHHRSHNPGF